MATRLVLIHTSSVLMSMLSDLASKVMPNVKISNILDDSLLPEVIREGGLTTNVSKRIALYVMAAEETGCDAVLNVCSSVGEAYDTAARLVRIPVLKIDEPMARKAAEIGGRIGVLATLKTTLDPTCRLIERCVAEGKKKAQIKRKLSDEAFQALISRDAVTHDRLVSKAIRDLAKTCDVIVLAQGSMARIVPLIRDEIKVPLLSSPELGMQYAAQMLKSKRQ